MADVPFLDLLRAMPLVTADPATLGELNGNRRIQRLEALLLDRSRSAGTASVLPLRAAGRS